MSQQTEKDLEQTKELFEFLQGHVPEGYKIKRGYMPRLTPEQAWSIIWYLGNLYWRVPDSIELCDICGDLYHTSTDGGSLDYGRAPYHFCGFCMYCPEYRKKSQSKLNPNRD
jgi:hypothetical protein